MFKGDLAITSAPQSLFTVNSKKFDLILASNELIDYLNRTLMEGINMSLLYKYNALLEVYDLR